MNTSRFTAGASRFAHFAGLSRKSRASDDDRQDDEPKGKKSQAEDDEDEDEDDQSKGKRSRASDDDGDQPKGKKSTASDEDDEDDAPKGKRSRAADDEGDEDEPRGKRSKASDDDEDEDDDEDDDKEEMSGRSAKASARLREQQRIAAILGNKAAARNPALAISLACETRMTRREAINVLKGQPERDDDDGDRRHSRSDRQSRNVRLGSDTAPPSGKQAAAASWDSAFKRVGIKTR